MIRTTILTAAFLIVATVPAMGAPIVEDNAVLNGDFELAASQARVATCLLFGNGYINVFQPGNPYGLPWLAGISPCHQSTVTALQWSHGSGALYEDFDGDGDREAKILPGVPDAQVGNHNMWQSYASPHQAWSAGFDTYSFRVEGGAIPASASVIISLSTSPNTTPHPFVGPYYDCSLRFSGALLAPDADGLVTIDPTEGVFHSAYVACNGAAAAWAGADSEERREILSGLRMVQNSFWNFNTGAGEVVIDDVKILGAPTFAEAAAGL